jgi:hypothetical protein
MKIPSGTFGQIPRRLEWRCLNSLKSTIPNHFLEIFEIFRGKEISDHKTEFFYLLNILPYYQPRQLYLSEVFEKV